VIPAAPIDLQRACDSDLEALAELMNAAYGGTGEVAGWTHVKDYLVGDRTSVSALRAEIGVSPQAQFLVLRSPSTGGLRGSVWLEPRSATVWYLGSLTVDPREQNSGLGRRILDAAERRLAALGVTRVVIDVLNVRGTLLAWYERRGYKLTGESHAFPYEDNRYGVPQRPDLKFLELAKDLEAGEDPGANRPSTPNPHGRSPMRSP
jgi:ribosomal protein S18 acetylase RimI-like enzyme